LKLKNNIKTNQSEEKANNTRCNQQQAHLSCEIPFSTFANFIPLRRRKKLTCVRTQSTTRQQSYLQQSTLPNAILPTIPGFKADFNEQ